MNESLQKKIAYLESMIIKLQAAIDSETDMKQLARLDNMLEETKLELIAMRLHERD